MNDRFKFRAFVKANEEIENVDDINYDAWEVGGKPLIIVGGVGRTEDEIVLMQCTGLKDKNGKLIYEGDVVTYDDRDIYPYHTPIFNAVIEMRKYQWCMVYYRKDIINADTREPAEQKTWLGFDDFITSRIEVIGNKFENPELLKECE